MARARACPASVIALAAALAVGCGGTRRVVAPATVAGPEAPDTDTPIGRDAAARDLEATVLEIYGHLTLGNFAAFRDTLAAEEPVTLIGVTPPDVVTGMRPRGAANDRRLYQSTSPSVLAKNLEVHLSADGSVGWTFDEMSYRVPHEGRTASIPVRNTSLFVRDIDRWVLVLEHQSYPTAIDDLRAAAAARRLPRPTSFSPRPLPAPARDLVRLIDLVHDADRRGRIKVASGGEALVLLPDRDHELHGADAADAPALAALFGPRTTVSVRDPRLGLARSGEVAWVAANLLVRTLVNDEPVEIGLRGTYVFRRIGRSWELVQMHVSAPVSEREVGRRVFGEP